jgi:hypothetical protein
MPTKKWNPAPVRRISPGVKRHLTVLLLSAAAVWAAEPRKFSSGPAQAHLIELFTSEGCSSCPPAETWLGALQGDAGLWRDFVPVAWHVNYWDRLGWPDRFATRETTDRQYLYANVWAATDPAAGRTVYTPCFTVNGEEWRERRGRRPPARGPDTGTLDAEIVDGVCRVRWRPAGGDGRLSYEAHVTLLGGGIVTQVRAGENRGETLRHDFVGLGLNRGQVAQDGTAEIPLPTTKLDGIPRRAVAVWITRKGSTEALQAAGAWLD